MIDTRDAKSNGGWLPPLLLTLMCGRRRRRCETAKRRSTAVPRDQPSARSSARPTTPGGRAVRPGEEHFTTLAQPWRPVC